MAEKRTTITKKMRFEVFKRDSFACQYCGMSAPEVILEVDHINPVNNGGETTLINLVTSCRDCNRGKGKRKLSDKSEIEKQKKQLEEINEKRKQLEMMLKWKEELNKFDDEQLAIFEKKVREDISISLSDYGKNFTKKLIKKYGLIEVLDVLDIAISQYFDTNNRDESFSTLMHYIPRICCTREKQKNDKRHYYFNYVRKVLKSNYAYVGESVLRNLIFNYVADEEDFLMVKQFIFENRNWTNFINACKAFFGVDLL